MRKPFLVTGIIGRNGSDAPIAVPDNQCCEALNVDFIDGELCDRRAGTEAPTITGTAFTAIIPALLRFVPGTDEGLAELFAFETGGGAMKRIAAGSAWATVTAIDASVFFVYELTGVSMGGFLFVNYDTAVNRSHVWDGSTLRRTGFATPAVPTLATLGGSGLTFTRYYRVRWVHISGSDTVRRSEASPIASLAITDDSGIRVTQPAVAGEGETHWEVEYADAEAGPFYVAGQVAIATTTFDDSDATVDTTNDLSPEDGINMPPPSFRYIAKGGARLLQGGAWESVAGDSFIPRDNEVYYTPVLGANDVGDLERQPINYRVSLDHALKGLSEAVNGVHYAFGYHGISALVPTGETGEGAFRRITERTDIGCIRHHMIVTADDELGNPCVYFWSHRGPYRIGPRGMQYIGHDIEDIQATINVSTPLVGHGLYYADKHQIWWWVATDANTTPNLKLVFDTRLGQTVAEKVTGGWSVHDGLSATALASVMFSETLSSTMSYRLLPYITPINVFTIWRCDTGTDDAGTDYQAYIDTKEYAPAGLGRNCSIVEPYLVAEASATAMVSVTARTDFGRDTSVSQAITLAPDQSETHVQRRVEGLQTSGIGTVRFRIGDLEATDPGFGVLDAFVAQYEAAEDR